MTKAFFFKEDETVSFLLLCSSSHIRNCSVLKIFLISCFFWIVDVDPISAFTDCHDEHSGTLACVYQQNTVPTLIVCFLR